MLSATSRIEELASIISTNSALVHSYFVTHNLDFPSLDVKAPADLAISDEAADVQNARKILIKATEELRALMMGPRELLRIDYTQLISLHAISRFKIAKSFPIGERVSFDTIAKATGLNEPTLRRVLRHGMMHHLFCEPEPQVVAHTALSKLLSEDELLQNYVSVALDELWPAAQKTVDALQMWPALNEPTQTGFSLANQTTMSMWGVFGEDPERGNRFGQAMSSMATVKGYEPSLLLNSYPWENIGNGNGTIIDVGGSHGSVMISVAEQFPSLRCIIQDLPRTVADGRDKLPDHLIGRVSFMEHDFLTPQPISADAYYFRWIFHNWSDKYCIRILRNLIPALKPGARILLNDLVVSPNAMTTEEERKVRNLDMVMLMLFNSHEREAHEWSDLFAKADPRFQYIGIKKPPGSVLSIIEAVWEG